MPQVPEVSAIVESVKARIKQLEGELAKHERLSDELDRLRDALGRLEGAARSRVGGRRGGGRTATAGSRSQPAGGTRPRASAKRAQPAGAARRSSTTARAPRGQNKAKVLEALTDGPMTASEVAKATGIATGTVSTLLTKLSKSGEVVKAERGYRLPGRSQP
jgi:CRP-like cAMP-binding protein